MRKFSLKMIIIFLLVLITSNEASALQGAGDCVEEWVGDNGETYYFAVDCPPPPVNCWWCWVWN